MLQFVVHNFLLRTIDQDESISTLINDAACVIVSILFARLENKTK